MRYPAAIAAASGRTTTGIHSRIARGGHLYLTDTAPVVAPHGLHILEVTVELDLRGITPLRSSRQRLGRRQHE